MVPKLTPFEKNSNWIFFLSKCVELTKLRPKIKYHARGKKVKRCTQIVWHKDKKSCNFKVTIVCFMKAKWTRINAKIIGFTTWLSYIRNRLGAPLGNWSHLKPALKPYPSLDKLILCLLTGEAFTTKSPVIRKKVICRIFCCYHFSENVWAPVLLWLTGNRPQVDITLWMNSWTQYGQINCHIWLKTLIHAAKKANIISDI